MRVLIAGGGTGGHVIPALAVAAELRRRSDSNEVLMVGTARGLEARLAPEHGVPLELIDIGALNRVSSFQVLATLWQLPVSFWQSLRIISDFQPDIVYGVGGYASGPVLLMAAFRDIPIVIHEPNAVPGFANRWIAPFVTRALLAFPDAARYFHPSRVEVVGVPVRSEFFLVPPRAHCPPYTILISGGSQGAHRLNMAVVEALPLFRSLDISFIHQTGERDYDAVRAGYALNGMEERATVVPFIYDMPQAFSRADLLVCRAGASTLAEIAAAGKAALLVPFPFAADDHQVKNAQSIERGGAARLLLDSQLTASRLFQAVMEMLTRLEDYEQRARSLAHPRAAESIVDTLVVCGRK